ncbi:tRNA (adenine(58)-N(1))-methyltransferase non-catalytic subunit TRM6 [Bacillus rossius redtenbacheri]|uniref:tRNA (adenine(58)-N(1))-methyltransferase non-catalytic subunit TRM6 n=1 Tax=Bacillus rossius redtenbacheri TaxID=93214 RepID=UPI002FDDF395
MSDKNGSSIVNVGDYVVIQRQKYSKLHKITKKCKVSLGKDQVELDIVVGKPVWTTYKMEIKSKKLFKLVECDCAESLAEQLIRDVSSGMDNRNIYDDGNSQLLSKDEIVGLRDSGLSGPEIVGHLIGNSKTFHNKTEYAQEKYLLKKEKKYFEYVTIRRPTLRLVTQIMFKQDPAKIMWLRMDTISQITTMVGIHSHGTYLLYDSGCLGLPAASMLNYIGENGHVINIHPGTLPQKEAIQAMNFSESHLSRMMTVNIHKLLCNVHGDTSNKCQESNSVGDLSKLAHFSDENLPKVDENHGSVTSEERAKICQNGRKCSDDQSTGEEVDNKKRKLEDGGTNLAKRPRWELEMDRAACLLRTRKADGLVVVAREHPVNIVTSLLPLVAASRPVVVYSAVREPLLDLYMHLKSRGDVVGLRLTETWLRMHQVLPDRTHPDMLMDGGGGYLLVGTAVEGRRC